MTLLNSPKSSEHLERNLSSKQQQQQSDIFTKDNQIKFNFSYGKTELEHMCTLYHEVWYEDDKVGSMVGLNSQIIASC